MFFKNQEDLSRILKRLFLKNLDYFLVLMLALICLFGLYQLVYDEFDSRVEGGDGVSGQDPLAEVTKRFNTVKKKSGTDIAWTDLKGKDRFFNQNQVYTHHNSMAELAFFSRGDIKLSENTLIKLERQGEETFIHLDKGTIFARLMNDKDGINLQVGNKRIRLRSKDAEVQVERSEAHVKVATLRGKAQVSLDEQSLQLRNHEVMTLTSTSTESSDSLIGPVQEVLVHQEGPSADQEIFLPGPSLTEPVSFKWSLASPLLHEKGVVGTFYLARDPEFRDMVLQKDVKETSLRWSPSFQDLDQVLYWKVVVHTGDVNEAEGSRTYSSMVRPLILRKDAPPRPLFPVHQSYLQTQDLGGGKNVLLEWESDPLSPISTMASFELEVLHEDKLIQSQSTHVPFFSLSLSDEGQYQWRVRYQDKLRPHSPWSEKSSFYYKKILLPPGPPHVTHPQDGHSLELKGESSSLLTFKWDKIDGVSAYLFTLYRDDGTREKVMERQVVGENLQVEFKEEGHFYWTLKGLRPSRLAAGEVSTSASGGLVIQKIMVKSASPPERREEVGQVKQAIQLVQPIHQATIPWEEQGHLQFQWLPDPQFTHYHVLFSSSLDFSRPILVQKTSQAELEMDMALFQEYFQQERNQRNQMNSGLEMEQEKEQFLYWKVIGFLPDKSEVSSLRRKLFFKGHESNGLLGDEKNQEKGRELANFQKASRESLWSFWGHWGPEYVKYEMIQAPLEVNIDGLALNSFMLGVQASLPSVSSFKRSLIVDFLMERKSGKVFTSMPYSQTSWAPHLGYHFLAPISGLPLSLLLKVGYSRIRQSLYAKISPTTLREYKANFSAFTLSTQFIFGSALSRFRHSLLLEGGVGELSLLSGFYDFGYRWSDHFDFRPGIRISKKKLEHLTTTADLMELQLVFTLMAFPFYF